MIFKFGKYKGKSFEEIYLNDKLYFKRLAYTKTSNKNMMNKKESLDFFNKKYYKNICCSICLEDIETSIEDTKLNNNYRLLTCGHIFHHKCFYNSLIHGIKKCPNCRNEIDKSICMYDTAKQNKLKYNVFIENYNNFNQLENSIINFVKQLPPLKDIYLNKNQFKNEKIATKNIYEEFNNHKYNTFEILKILNLPKTKQKKYLNEVKSKLIDISKKNMNSNINNEMKFGINLFHYILFLDSKNYFY